MAGRRCGEGECGARQDCPCGVASAQRRRFGVRLASAPGAAQQQRFAGKNTQAQETRGQNDRPRSLLVCLVSLALPLLLVLVGLRPEKRRFSSGWFFDEDVRLLLREYCCCTTVYGSLFWRGFLSGVWFEASAES